MARWLLSAVLLLLGPLSAQAASPPPTNSQNTSTQPALLAFGGSYYDFKENDPRDPAVDLRFEYRPSLSLLPTFSNYFQSWNDTFQLRPYTGIMLTTDGAFYGFGGLLFEFLIGQHFFITPSTAVGFYDRGNGKRLGSIIEFRSMLEAGYRFESGLRLSAQISHISNAGMTGHNPGSNMLGAYVQIPASWVFE